MRYLPGSEQMKRADQYTIGTLGVPSLKLMERAAAGCVRVMQEQGFDLSSVCVVCGSGNNGGDGFAIARMLLQRGFCVRAVMAGNRAHCTEECKEQIRLYEEAGGELFNGLGDGEYSIIVDALFGVGLSRSVEGRYAALIGEMNERKALKFAVDIPSGLSADTGNVLGTAFRADCTVTFQNRKFGMEVYPGKQIAGKVFAVDIGISDEPLRAGREVVRMPEEADYRRMLPARPQDSNKGTFGRLLVIAGSRGMCGAAYFNARAAYLAGAGLVRIYTPEENRAILQTLLPEAIVTPCGDFDREELKNLLGWADAVAVGSGIGISGQAERIIETVFESCGVPCVIDADGLNLLSRHMEWTKRALHGNYILTPHMKEMERLSGVPVPDIKRDRLHVLGGLTERTGFVCVLKDSRTVAGAPGGHFWLNPSGNSAMAKAGSGDILAGLTAGLLAQGSGCMDAAVLATYLHGRAGDRARSEKGPYSVMAADIMEHIGTVMRDLSGGLRPEGGKE